jgi:hypothetical protein
VAPPDYATNLWFKGLLGEASMFKHFLYKLMNKITTYPSRKSILESAKEIELEQKASQDAEEPDAEALHAVQEYCCVLWWDETVGRADEPITVSSDAACDALAKKWGANRRANRRPLKVGRCAPI